MEDIRALGKNELVHVDRVVVAYCRLGKPGEGSRRGVWEADIHTIVTIRGEERFTWPDQRKFHNLRRTGGTVAVTEAVTAKLSPGDD